MLNKIRRVSGDTRSLRNRRLFVETLEERRVMDAAGLAEFSAGSAVSESQVLVAYQHSETAVVRHGARGASLGQTLAQYTADPSVRYAEPDFRVHVATVPNDPYVGSTWGLHNTGQNGGKVDADIDAPEAWNVVRGSTSVTVAVIDSGIDYSHPDLYQNIWINQGEIPSAIRSLLVDLDGDKLITFRDLNDSRNQGSGKITDLNGNGYIDGRDLLYSTSVGGWADRVSNDGDKYVDDLVGWNFVNNTNDPSDDNGHGTHVAGTIGASANNGKGVAGVLWDVQLVGLKFLDATGGGYVSSAIAAVNYAVSKSITLSNNSWGGGDYSQALYDAINTARSYGHIFVAAAGNGGSDGIGDSNDTAPQYPSDYDLDNIIAVAATDNQDNLGPFSNYGATSVDLAAPGVNILSTVPGGYGYASGTSMAAPHVSGVVAMVQSQHPSWSYSQTIAQVTNNGDKLASLNGKVLSGSRLNAHRAVSATPADTAGPRVVSAVANATGTSPVSSVRVTFSEAINPATFTVADITSFSGPNGLLKPSGVVSVAGSAGKAFDVTFSTQSTPGTYRFNIGPDVRDAAGNAMDQDSDGVTGESADDRYTAQFAINGKYTYTSKPYVKIRDASSTTVSLNVDRDIMIADLNVKLDIAHAATGNLRVYLISPDTLKISLVQNRGGFGDHFRGTVLDDEASTAIAQGKAPFSGSYRPEEALQGFDGKSARGTWRLVVEDVTRGNTGKLRTWALTFEGAVGSAASRTIGGSATAGSFASGGAPLVSQLLAAKAVNAADSGKLQSLTSGVAARATDAVHQELANREEPIHRAAIFAQAGESLVRVASRAGSGAVQQSLSHWATAVDDLLSQDELTLPLESLLRSGLRR